VDAVVVVVGEGGMAVVPSGCCWEVVNVRRKVSWKGETLQIRNPLVVPAARHPPS